MKRHSLPCLAAFLLTVLAAQPSMGSYVETLRTANEGLLKFVLDNGLICLVKEDRSAPVAALQIWVRVGSIHEEEFLGGGLSHYLEHMVFKGTPTRGPGEISRSIDNAGGDINAYTSFDRTVYHAEIPSAHWRTAVEVFADAVMNASMPEEEWEKEREVVFREVDMGKDDPGRELSKLLFATAYQVHPMRVPVIGHEDVLRTMTREELLAFHRRHYTPDNMIVSIVGDFDSNEVAAHLREAFAPYPRRARAPVVLPEEPVQLAPRFARKTGAYNVSRLHWAYPATSLSHPDTPALDVLAQVLGQGRSSRLVREVKERRELAFSIGAWAFTPIDRGLLTVSATFAPEREAELLEAIEEELFSWVDTPFTEEELDKARRQVLVDALSQLQTSSGQSAAFASGEFYVTDPRYSETYIEKLNALTPEDLHRVARTYLHPRRRTLVILSPETESDAMAREEIEPLTRPIERVELENGITLLVRADRRLPFVHIATASLGGLLSETEENNGISQLMADLLTRGTVTRTAEEIADTVESLGGSLTAYAGRNSFGMMARSLTSDAEAFMGLLADCLLNSVFPGSELEKQKEVQIASIRQQRERPMFLAQQLLMQNLYPAHPYRWNESGSEETVSTLTHEVVREHAAALTTTSNLVISIFGDISREAAEDLVRRHLADVPEGPRPVWNHPRPEPALPLLVQQREPRQQSILLLGYPGVPIDDPRSDVLTILSTALSGLSSDLLIEIRDKRGLVYFAGAFQRLGLDPGCFVFYAGTQEESVDEVKELLQAQADRIRESGLNEEEWQRALEQIVSRSERELQQNGSLAQTCALNELYGLGHDHSLRTRARLEAITADDFRATAGTLLRPELSVVSKVLPLRDEVAALAGHED